jgi:LysR family transcriptional regulator (chromosome initiation inhibitor)
MQRIPLAVNADSLGTWMIPALSQVASIATFEIHREDEEYSTGLLHDGTVMAAVTSAAQPVPGCRSIRLGKMRYRPLATAGFIERWLPNGPTAKDLSAAPVVMFDRKDEMQSRYIRRHVRNGTEPPRHYVPSTADFASAVLSGMGWGYISDIQAETFGQNHELYEFDPGSSIEVSLFWQQWKLSSSVLDEVAKAVCDYAAANVH